MNTQTTSAIGAAWSARGDLPPMLRHYLELKGQYPDCLIFFQVGDFYELFFDDAVTVSKTLNLTLTSRDKNDPNPIPMCGVPIAVVDGYVARLVDRGFSAALVSQEPVEEGAKGAVPRSLDRVITPGVRVLGGSEGAATRELVGSVVAATAKTAVIALADITGGTIAYRDGISWDDLPRITARLRLAEIIVPKTSLGLTLDRRTSWIRKLLEEHGEFFIKFRAESKLDDAGKSSRMSDIPNFAALPTAVRKVVGQLVSYLDEVTVKSRISFSSITPDADDGRMIIDATTQKNLDLIVNSRDGSERATLLGFLHCTATIGGRRLLESWIASPLTNEAAINERLECVRTLKEKNPVRVRLRELLAKLCDLPRVATRVELGCVTPRELGALRDSLQVIPEMVKRVQDLDSSPRGEALSSDLKLSPVLCGLLERSLSDTPPLQIAMGGVIRQGLSEDLDRLRDAQANGQNWISQLEIKERSQTGIATLKIKSNGVLGYFFETSNAQAGKIPSRFVPRQSTSNTQRFITDELRSIERELVSADGSILRLEKKLFDELCCEVSPYLKDLRAVGAALAELDVLAAFADLADRFQLVRPRISREAELEIDRGKHPVLVQLLGGACIANSLTLGGPNSNAPSCFVVTGPNMGGKSTFLRQIALICIMAQVGCFVPAASARVGVVDRLFARIGAGDNLADGESTFMVEMREAAFILQHATSQSLVIVDELGRGTATADGRSLAQSVLEELVTKICARVLFATHYYELTELAGAVKGLGNLSVGVHESPDGIVFTHEIHNGPAERSYGLDVARLAGIPKRVVSRAKSILDKVRDSESLLASRSQLSLFSSEASPAQTLFEQQVVHSTKQSEVIGELTALTLDDVTPRRALELLGELQEKLRE